MRWLVPDARSLLLGLAVVLLFPAVPARANLIVVDFETTPSLPRGPMTFVRNAPRDIVVVPDLATISGGVVVGDPSFLEAFPARGSAPNLYGTSLLNPNLSPTIAIDFSPSAVVTNVQGRLFNGLTIPASFTVRAFLGAAQVATQILTNVLENFEPLGFRDFNLSAVAISRLTITPLDTSIYDYFIDNVAVTFSPSPSPIPEPSSLVLLGSGIPLGVGLALRRAKAKRGL